MSSGTDTFANDGLIVNIAQIETDSSGGTLDLSGQSDGFIVIGGAGNDIITGSSGDDSITSGGGTDDLTGGSGNDTYVINHVNDVVTEESSEGTDLIQSSVSFTPSN